MKRPTAKKLSLVFGAVALPALSGCATLNATDTQSCMSRQGFSLMGGLVSARSDSYNNDCATAKAAATIAAMRKSDGSPDIQAYALAVSIYEKSNPAVRSYMEKMLEKKQGKTIDQVRFAVKQSQAQKDPLVCHQVSEKDSSGKTVVGFQCKKSPAP